MPSLLKMNTVTDYSLDTQGEFPNIRNYFTNKTIETTAQKNAHHIGVFNKLLDVGFDHGYHVFQFFIGWYGPV